MADCNLVIFVYGTLKAGECRSHFLEDMEFLGVAQTSPLYRLFDCGEYPALVEHPAGDRIEGELWRVTEVCLSQLDREEGVDIGLYRRAPVDLQPPYDSLMAQTYLYSRSIEGLVDLGTRWSS
jgi:gamma-glutamylaminecyclotransferase